MRTLLPHQWQALAWLEDNPNKGALFMEMRLGKTLVCIRYALSHSFKRVLVVAPIEGLWAWQRELTTEGENYIVVDGPAKERIKKLSHVSLSSHRTYYLLNYEGALALQGHLDSLSFDLIILDESRRIANPKAKTSKVFLKLPYKKEKRLVLSGKPAPETPLEYFNQFAFVEDSFAHCNNYWRFREKFFHEITPHEWVPKPNQIEMLKYHIHASAFFLSRKQAGMPDNKVYETRTLKLPPSVRKMYETAKKDFVAAFEGKILKSTKWVPVQYIWMHQLASGFLGDKLIWDGKLKQVVSLLEGELKNEQVVVWFNFNAPLFALSKLLRNKVSKHILVGDLSREERENAIDNFRAGNTQVLLCQIKCGKTAIDLSNSSTAIYFNNSYSLEARAQSEDRILNPLKKEPNLYLDLVTEDTVDEDILEILKYKNYESKFYISTLLERIKCEKK